MFKGITNVVAILIIMDRLVFLSGEVLERGSLMYIALVFSVAWVGTQLTYALYEIEQIHKKLTEK